MGAPVPLDPYLHGQLRVRAGPDFTVAEGQQVLPVVAHEFAAAAMDCPVVFIKSAETGQFQPVALLGLAKGENLMVAGGKWLGLHCPAVLYSPPFKLMVASAGTDAEQVAVGIDAESPLVIGADGGKDGGKEGRKWGVMKRGKEAGKSAGKGGASAERLFTDEGELSEYMKKRRDALEAYYQQTQLTQQFSAYLAKHELLSSRRLDVRLGEEASSIDGIFLADEQKLQSLQEKALFALHRRGYLQVIYAHLASLQQAKRLLKLKLDGARGGD